MCSQAGREGKKTNSGVWELFENDLFFLKKKYTKLLLIENNPDILLGRGFIV